MDKIIRGKAFVLGDDVNTDEIIPAEHLSYNPADPEERRHFGCYALSGVPIEHSGLPGGNVRFVEEGRFETDFAVIVAGRNFGCGSSREHAPLAIAQAGCRAVVAQSYARIFYRNSINGGYLLPFETPRRLVDEVATGDEVELDTGAGELRLPAKGKVFELSPLGDAGEIVEAGGIFDYAKRAGILH